MVKWQSAKALRWIEDEAMNSEIDCFFNQIQQ